MAKRKLRAIDVYSGVGGWALGLRMAGVEVVASFDHWSAANETNFKNNKHQAQTVDIRRLDLEDLPANIDFVVGSPPCTQFSYSNRGGSGDVRDGLRDIVRFLTIVDHIRPKAWAMENVPRVAGIIEKELKGSGCLRKFKHLEIGLHVVNMADFGLPQRRKRCIAGNFDFELLQSYASRTLPKSLGDIVASLREDPVIDPTYGFQIPRCELVDHTTEDVLDAEETRINSSNKIFHPVYNSMPFPDPLDRSARTVTATCTRVSRESIVIESGREPGTFRRLTVRERASLQGFPINFQFYAPSYTQKLQMVGNAIPPSFAYFVAQSLRHTPLAQLPPLSDRARSFEPPVTHPIDTPAERSGRRFPRDRTFRFAIPSLRLKSGVRFELTNKFGRGEQIHWEVAFYFGTSKSIHSLSLDGAVLRTLKSRLPRTIRSDIESELDRLEMIIREADVARMQAIWTHRGVGGTRPFMLLDELEQAGLRIRGILKDHVEGANRLVTAALEMEYGSRRMRKLLGLNKLARNAPLIAAGFLVASLANVQLVNRSAIVTKKAAGAR